DKLDNIFDTINKLTIQIEKLALETKYMREDYNDLSARVINLEQKPIKRYDSAITSVITGVIGAIVGAVMALIIRR
ncbi:MAG: hypothetical protein IKO78_00005, partial [Bacilli bacterium]|nr:hypothetical protein [Bacilli bacterium]